MRALVSSLKCRNVEIKSGQGEKKTGNCQFYKAVKKSMLEEIAPGETKELWWGRKE